MRILAATAIAALLATSGLSSRRGTDAGAGDELGPTRHTVEEELRIDGYEHELVPIDTTIRVTVGDDVEEHVAKVVAERDGSSLTPSSGEVQERKIQQEQDVFTVRDSLGVRVVEYQAIPTDLPRWLVEDVPSIELGSVAGGRPDSFGNIGGVVGRSDGGVVVADWFNVVAFDSSGSHLWTSGREGEGPGEFEYAISGLVGLPGDTVVADATRNPNVFGPDGTAIGTMRLPPAPPEWSRPRLIGSMNDGTFVSEIGTRLEDSGATGFLRAAHRFVIHAKSGEIVAEVGPFDGATTRLSIVSVPGPSGDIVDATMFAPVIMSPELSVGVGRDQVVVGLQDRFELRWFGKDGRLAMIQRIDADPVSTDFDRYIAQRVDGMDPDPASDTRRRIRRAIEDGLIAERLPAFDQIMLDSGGNLWVGEYLPAYEERPTRWWIFRPDGEVVAEAELPIGFQPQVIRDEEIVGLWFDELKVPYVQVRKLLR